MLNSVPTLSTFDLPIYLKEAFPGISREQIREFLDAYQEHWRTYHHLGYIIGMIRSAERHFKTQCSALEWRALLAMICGHEIILKVGELSANNESASADFTADIIRDTGGPIWFERCIWRGINATKSHRLEGVPPKERTIVSYLLDLDLESLGLSDEAFAANTEAIWLEFQPITTRGKYDQGRQAWANSFLARPRIFQTDVFFALYEEQARENLDRLISA